VLIFFLDSTDMTQEDITLFLVGFTMIGYALGSVLAIVISLFHFVLKGRKGDAYNLSRQDY